MITLPAHKVRQFGVEFYQTSFTSGDIQKLVKFEVLSYAAPEEGQKKSRSAKTSPVNWGLLEKRIGQSEAAFQRPMIRKKIRELVQYYAECQEAQNLPAIPGAVIMITEKRVDFSPMARNPNLGMIQIPEEPGILRCLDGQHRLLALSSQEEKNAEIDVPAVLFDSLDPRQTVELFVTINAKHTRLNPSHLVSLAGRRLYADPHQALAHDIIRQLNEEEDSPLQGDIKILGVGKGRVSQASLADEMVDLFGTIEKVGGPNRFKEFEQNGKRFFMNYFKGIQVTFPKAWAGRKYSIKTGAALRAFIRVGPDVMARSRELKNDPFDHFGIREAIKPWGERMGEGRFETDGEWRRKLAGGTRGTVELLTRELQDAMKAP
ncbi:MAG TPA: DGQHR domain-containing protein [Thermodesulfobacteriota bacterium]|nr:DGQHR domain-containing protein [Thermodesulfobacteriota bacterium]